MSSEWCIVMDMLQCRYLHIQLFHLTGFFSGGGEIKNSISISVVKRTVLLFKSYLFAPYILLSLLL